MINKINKLFFSIFLFFAYFIIFSCSMEAHDLWLNIDNYYPRVGEKIIAKVIFGHNFPYPDIFISKEELTEFSYLLPDSKKIEIAETREEKAGERQGALIGEIPTTQEGTCVLIACRKREGDPKNVPSEKYAKSLIVVGKGSKNVNYIFGHRLEIVPLKNPSELSAGDCLPVRVLFEGKPLSTYVYATYARYYSKTEPFPFFSKSNKDGIAHIKIDRPGIWLVVCNHKVSISSTLTFMIK